MTLTRGERAARATPTHFIGVFDMCGKAKQINFKPQPRITQAPPVRTIILIASPIQPSTFERMQTISEASRSLGARSLSPSPHYLYSKYDHHITHAPHHPTPLLFYQH